MAEQKQKYLIAQGLCENTKEILKEEKEKGLEMIKKVREQG